MTSRRTRGMRRIKPRSAYEGEVLPTIAVQHPSAPAFVPNPADGIASEDLYAPVLGRHGGPKEGENGPENP